MTVVCFNMMHILGQSFPKLGQHWFLILIGSNIRQFKWNCLLQLPKTQIEIRWNINMISRHLLIALAILSFSSFYSLFSQICLLHTRILLTLFHVCDHASQQTNKHTTPFHTLTLWHRPVGPQPGHRQHPATASAETTSNLFVGVPTLYNSC